MQLKEEPTKRGIYLRAMVFVVLTLLAALLLFLAFVGGIIGSILTGNYEFLILGLIFFIMFMGVMVVAKRFEWAWQKLEDLRGARRKTTRETLKESSRYVIIAVVVIILALISDEYFRLFPSDMSPSLAQEILKSVLTIDGILIGLSGVILAQFLWAIHSKGNILYEQTIEHRNDKAVLSQVNDEIELLGRTRLAAILAIFYSLMPILASFIISLSKLPLTETSPLPSPRVLLFDPIISLVVGVILLAMVSLSVNLLPKKTKIIDKENDAIKDDYII
jgi:hypothetical protein